MIAQGGVIGKKMNRIIGLLSVIGLSLWGDMPEPYSSIKSLPFDGHGWFGNEEPLLALMTNRAPRVAIEVGSWLGCSTRFIASHLPEGGKLYAVDTWRGSPGEVVHMEDPRLPNLYQLFLSNVKHAGLTEVIVPMRMRSLEASRALAIQADLIYLDASHETENVYQDIIAWHPHLSPGGVLCGDDWSWPSVRKGVNKAADELKCQVLTAQNFWWFEP